jgi:hypothetical protein
VSPPQGWDFFILTVSPGVIAIGPSATPRLSDKRIYIIPYFQRGGTRRIRKIVSCRCVQHLA